MPIYEGRASGRICLLGDNTDLIEKPALAAAISAFLTIDLEKNGNRHVRMTARDLSYVEEFPLGATPSLESPLRYLNAIYLRLKDRIDSGFDATVRSDIPVGSGLSSSSALCIAFIRALGRAFDLELSPAQVAELAFVVENLDLGVECGRMDQYAIAYGGVSYIETGSQPRVESLATPELPVIVADTQEKHNTRDLQVWLRKRLSEAEPLLLSSLERVVGLVEEGRKAILAADLPLLGELMQRQQREEKLMGTSTERLELLCAAALRSGALGAKQMGAGGGGCIVALCTREGQEKVKEALESLGAPAWAFRVAGR